MSTAPSPLMGAGSAPTPPGGVPQPFLGGGASDVHLRLGSPRVGCNPPSGSSDHRLRSGPLDAGGSATLRGNVVFSWASEPPAAAGGAGGAGGSPPSMHTGTLPPTGPLSGAAGGTLPGSGVLLGGGGASVTSATTTSPNLSAMVSIASPSGAGVLSVPASPAIAQAVMQSTVAATTSEKVTAGAAAASSVVTTVEGGGDPTSSFFIPAALVSTEQPAPLFHSLTEALERTHAQYRAGQLEPREYHQNMAQLMVQLHAMHNPTTAAVLSPLQGVSGCPEAVTPAFVTTAGGPALIASSTPPAGPAARSATSGAPPVAGAADHTPAPLPVLLFALKLLATLAPSEAVLPCAQVVTLASLDLLAAGLRSQLDAFTAVLDGPAAASAAARSREVLAAARQQPLLQLSSDVRDLMCDRDASTRFGASLGAFANAIFKCVKRERVGGLSEFHAQLRTLATEGATRRWDGLELLGFLADFMDAVNVKLRLPAKAVLASAVFGKLERVHRGDAAAAVAALLRLVDIAVPQSAAIADLMHARFAKVPENVLRAHFGECNNILRVVDLKSSGTAQAGGAEHSAGSMDPATFLEAQRRLFSQQSKDKRTAGSQSGSFICEVSSDVADLFPGSGAHARVAGRSCVELRPWDAPPGVAALSGAGPRVEGASATRIVRESEVLTQTDRSQVSRRGGPGPVTVRTLVSEQATRDSGGGEHRAAVNTYIVEEGGTRNVLSFAAPAEFLHANAAPDQAPFGTIGATLHTGIRASEGSAVVGEIMHDEIGSAMSTQPLVRTAPEAGEGAAADAPARPAAAAAFTASDSWEGDGRTGEEDGAAGDGSLSPPAPAATAAAAEEAETARERREPRRAAAAAAAGAAEHRLIAPSAAATGASEGAEQPLLSAAAAAVVGTDESDGDSSSVSEGGWREARPRAAASGRPVPLMAGRPSAAGAGGSAGADLAPARGYAAGGGGADAQETSVRHSAMLEDVSDDVEAVDSTTAGATGGSAGGGSAGGGSAGGDSAGGGSADGGSAGEGSASGSGSGFSQHFRDRLLRTQGSGAFDSAAAGRAGSGYGAAGYGAGGVAPSSGYGASGRGGPGYGAGAAAAGAAAGGGRGVFASHSAVSAAGGGPGGSRAAFRRPTDDVSYASSARSFTSSPRAGDEDFRSARRPEGGVGRQAGKFGAGAGGLGAGGRATGQTASLFGTTAAGVAPARAKQPHAAAAASALSLTMPPSGGGAAAQKFGAATGGAAGGGAGGGGGAAGSFRQTGAGGGAGSRSAAPAAGGFGGGFGGGLGAPTAFRSSVAGNSARSPDFPRSAQATRHDYRTRPEYGAAAAVSPRRAGATGAVNKTTGGAPGAGGFAAAVRPRSSRAAEELATRVSSRF